MRHAIHVITCNTRVYNFISSLELHITYFQSSPVKLGHPSRTKNQRPALNSFERYLSTIRTRFVKRRTGPMVCPPRSLTLSSVSGPITVQMYSNKNGIGLECGQAWLIRSLGHVLACGHSKGHGGRKEKMPRARPIATSRTSGIDWVFRSG